MKSIQERRLEFIDKALKKFLEDPSQRAVENGTCCYRTSDGRSCLIGQFIKNEDYKKDMEGFNVSANDICSRLPNDILGLQDWFLLNMQRFHDDHKYWTETGLSEAGLKKLKWIKYQFCSLDIDLG